MRVVPERAPWLQTVAVFGGFFIGPFAALRVAALQAPGSELVQTVGVLAFAMVFAGGAVVWLGLGLAAVIVRFFASLVRGRAPAPETPAARDRLVPPGYAVFVMLGVAAGSSVGVLAGVATDLSIPLATVTWALLGLGYGLLLWAAAHHGYLPFDPE